MHYPKSTDEKARAVKEAKTTRSFLTAAFCERVSGCCPASLPEGLNVRSSLATTLRRQAGQKLLLAAQTLKVITN